MVATGFSQRTRTIDLEEYKWKNRLLVVFSPSEDYARYRDLRKQLQDQKSAIVDRDLLVFHVFEDGESWFGDSLIDKQSVAQLRSRFSAKPGEFTVVLIGKDGGEKLRRGTEVDIAEIFSLIDSMPMRQREMRERR